jgi:hypothetical protein
VDARKSVVALLPPASLGPGTEPVPAGDVGGQLAEQPDLEALLHRQEVAVPAPLVKDAEQAAVALGEPDQLVGLCGPGHQRLSTTTWRPASKAAGELVVGRIGGGHHHQLHGRVLEQLGGCGDHSDAIIVTVMLRSVVRRAGLEALHRHWPGSGDGLAAVTRLCGLTRQPNPSAAG